MTIDNDASRQTGEDYRYRNVRPLATFAFAFLAALGALGMTAAAHGALTRATEKGVIADPPDLRKVIDAVEDKAAIRIQDRGNAVAYAEGTSGDRAASGYNLHARGH